MDEGWGLDETPVFAYNRASFEKGSRAVPSDASFMNEVEGGTARGSFHHFIPKWCKRSVAFAGRS